MNINLLQPPKIILASTSTYRKKLIEEGLGIRLVAKGPHFNEEEYKLEEKSKKLNPYKLSQTLSYLKGKSVAEKDRNNIVISGDQVCYGLGKIWDKPLTREKAIDCLSQLQGNSHELITTISLFFEGEVLEHQNITALTMVPLHLEDINNYINFANPLDCAGAYKIEVGGMSLFSKIESNDFSAIQGVPLLFVRSVLQKWNVKFWSQS
ncbi:MAG: Maf family protein [Bacteriovoracaceae bacterium]|nr:Maf family protein [Bacteriovoracaceae bacterium]